MPYTLLPLSDSKPIFHIQEDETLFGKGNLTKREQDLQKVAAALGLAPTIHSIMNHNGMKVTLMERIHGMSLADHYGEDPSKLPPWLWSQIRSILQTLWNHGIEYKDITPYNFMLETGTDRLWIVDFGHARRIPMNPHLRHVLQGNHGWNRDFQ